MFFVTIVIVTATAGAVVGFCIGRWLDTKEYEDVVFLWQSEVSELEQTMKQRERMHINTINDLHKRLLERDKQAFLNTLSPDEKKVVQEKWLDMLIDVSEPAPSDDVNYGGF